MHKYNSLIAIIEPVGGYGGMNYYDFGLAKGLFSAHCKAVIYTSVETNIPNGLPFIINKTFKGIWGNSPKILRGIRFIFCLISSLKDAKANKINIIHYHFFHYTFLEAICVKFAKKYDFKIVITAHDIESFSGKGQIDKAKKILFAADRIIAHNNVSKEELLSKLLLPPSNIYVVPHGNYLESIIDLPNKSISRKVIGLSPKDKVILFFGNIKNAKGLDILLCSLSDVILQYPELKLLIAGKVWKNDFAIYKKIIKENGLEDKVISHIRYIPDDNVANYYRAADIVVLPYRKIYQSGVLLMAMSYKVPVLTSDIQGMTEVISDGINGYVFETENVKNLSSRLIDVLSNDEDLVRMGESGFKTVVKDYNWDRIGEMTVKVYKSIGNE